MYKLRCYVPLYALKIVYFSLFYSYIQYSLLNRGKASKSILYKLKILQNIILRTMLFCTKLFCSKLDDMIAMKYAKFIFKFNNHMLPDSFNYYFTKLENVNKCNTKQKRRNEYFQFCISSESG